MQRTLARIVTSSVCLVMCITALAASARAAEILDEQFGVVKAAEGCAFTEGPTVDADGNLFFSDGRNDRIMRLSAAGELSVFRQPCGRANGLLFDNQGRLMMCQSSGEGGGRRVTRLEKDGSETVLAETYNGARFIAPNDLCIDSRGRVYFTDPYYGPPAEKSQPTSGVYRIDAPGDVKLVIDHLQRPNGIVITPDERTLYVSDRGTQKLHRYRVSDNGELAPDGVVYDFSPDRGIDGMWLDVQGNIYGAAGQDETTGLFVVSPQGELLLHQPMPEFSTNVTFGGADMRDLFLTATTSVYKMRTTTPGVRRVSPATETVALPAADSIQPTKLLTVPAYCEGVVFDHEGAGYISWGKSITRFTLDGSHRVWAETGAPNGHKILADGTHLVCDASRHAVLRLAADGQMLEPASTSCNDVPLRGPNDLTLDTANGGFYFTDPGGSSDTNPIGTVHYVDKDGVTYLIDEGLAYPNGIVLRPDGKSLLVAESKKNRVLEYPITAAGKAGQRRVFAELPVKDEGAGQIDNQPDGMCLDAAGNLYIAHYGMRQVQVLSPSGKIVARYNGGNITTSNVAFGGPNMEQLFVTGGLGNEAGEGGLFRLDLGVKGQVILPEKK